MDDKMYAELVIAELYKRTVAGTLAWRVDRDSLTAEPTPVVRTRISFEDEGPNSAKWKTVVITHPVGSGITFFVNPDEPIARYRPFDLSEETILKVSTIFQQIVLEPRLRHFQSALAELLGA